MAAIASFSPSRVRSSGIICSLPAPTPSSFRGRPLDRRSTSVLKRIPGSNGTGRISMQRQKSLVTIAHSTSTEEAQVDLSALPPLKPDISEEELLSVDLRVGVVVHADLLKDPEASAKRGQPTDSRTHLKLEVNIGGEERTIVAAIRYVWDKEDAVGKKVLVAVNVPKKTVLGVESHGIIMSGLNFDPTPMPRTYKVIMPGLGKLPAGSQFVPVAPPPR